ncbi:integral membrane protein [Fusarium sp. NRRL 52700]|nr:integral membrane protein [Fusarium sp. NRRL 52700]
METDPMVIAIFGHPPEGIDLSANQELRNTTIVLSMLFLSALFLAGRIAIRTQQSHLSLDDYIITVSWLFVAITAAIVVIIGQAVPVPEVVKLQMSSEKKVTVLTVLALGGLVCIASGLRIHYLITWTKSIDTTWTMGSVAIWSSVEASMGIISACLPSFRSYLGHLCWKSKKKNRPSFRAGRISGKAKRLQSDEEIALQSQKSRGNGESHFGQGESNAGRGKGNTGLVKSHIGQGSERREVFIRTGTKQIVIEIPDAARLRPRVETGQRPGQPKNRATKPVHVAHLVSKLSPV